VIPKNGRLLPLEVYLCFITYEDKKAYMVYCNPLEMNINKKDIINKIKSDLVYDNFKNLDDKTLDLSLIVCKKILDAFAKGDIHYIEKLVMNIHEIIFEIKEKRLFNNP
jgi:hypothetical protein